jgi:outer membrane protein
MKYSWMFAACAACAGLAHGENLLNVYDRALTADPLMQQAVHIRQSVLEVKTQALLGLLPINGYANKTWYGLGSAAINQPATADLVLNVNVFNWASWVNLKSANATVAQAEANYIAAQQNLIQRVTSQYFAVLSAQDALNAQQTALESVDQQLEQAQRRFEVGLIAVTDVQVAQASRDSTAAAVIAAKRTLANTKEQLRTITGEIYPQLAAPGDDMPLLSPSPASEDHWVSVAMDQNASLIASRLSAEIARDAVQTAYSGHLPNISISASRAWALSNRDQTTTVLQTGNGIPGGTVNTTDIMWAVGVTVPIFTAGATQSKVRQAREEWYAAQSGYEYTSRATQQQAHDAYQGVLTQIAEVQALKQAVESNQVSLQATQAGYDVGTKTALDVLTSREALVQAQTNYSQAKYQYLSDLVSLRLAAGNLDRGIIDQINGWLHEPTPAAGTPATTPPATAPATSAPATPAAAP